MKNKRSLTKFLALALAVLMMLASFTACGTANTNSDVDSLNNSEVESITITVKVISADKSEKTFTIETNRKYLGDALYDEGLVNEEEHKSGFYTYINGVRADYTADKSWWCFTKGGETVMVGANELEIADGDQFEITNTPA
jgi:hypothetical protein